MFFCHDVFQKWEEKAQRLKQKYKQDLEEYKASGKAASPSPRSELGMFHK